MIRDTLKAPAVEPGLFYGDLFVAFDAIIFDCDGVLVDSEILGLDASAAYLRSHGLDWSPAELVRRFTGLRDDVFAERLTAHFRDRHGADPAQGFFEGLVETRRAKRHLLQPVKGAEAALAALSLPKAVASSSRTKFLHGKMRRTGLFHYFAPHIYSAELVRQGKPAPDIFLFAADKLGADPARCLVIEDSVNGVLSGLAAGMTVWGFLGGGHCFDGHGERLAAAGAARTVDDFEDLTRRLDAS